MRPINRDAVALNGMISISPFGFPSILILGKLTFENFHLAISHGPISGNSIFISFWAMQIKMINTHLRNAYQFHLPVAAIRDIAGNWFSMTIFILPRYPPPARIVNCPQRIIRQLILPVRANLFCDIRIRQCNEIFSEHWNNFNGYRFRRRFRARLLNYRRNPVSLVFRLQAPLRQIRPRARHGRHGFWIEVFG